MVIFFRSFIADSEFIFYPCKIKKATKLNLSKLYYAKIVKTKYT